MSQSRTTTRTSTMSLSHLPIHLAAFAPEAQLTSDFRIPRQFSFSPNSLQPKPLQPWRPFGTPVKLPGAPRTRADRPHHSVLQPSNKVKCWSAFRIQSGHWRKSRQMDRKMRKGSGFGVQAGFFLNPDPLNPGFSDQFGRWRKSRQMDRA